MRTIYWYLHFVLSTILTLPRLKKYSSITNEDERLRFANEYVAKWAKAQYKASGSTIVINGLDNLPKNEAVLFISNHQSNFDIDIFMSYINTHKGFVSKIEMQKVPIISKWMEAIQCVFIDRNDIRQTAGAFLKGIELLKCGYSLVVFPEGTRSKSSTMGEFKAGSLKLATKSKVRIVPVTINGSYKIMEANNSRIKPAEVVLTIHPPVATDGLSAEELAALPKKIENIIQSELN